MRVLFLILIVALESCVSSLQPLVTADTVTTDQRITGTWTHDGDTYSIIPLLKSEFATKEAENSKSPRDLNEEEKRDSILTSKMYVISFKEKGTDYRLGAKLIKLNGQLFADLSPLSMNDEKQKDQEDPYAIGKDFLPGFTIAKIELNGSAAMTIKFIDGDFVVTQIKEGRMKLKHESNELFGTFIVTASTEELKQFISKYGDDERIFSKSTAITLTRKLNL